MLTGNRDRIDADLLAAGIRPGDPRLTHTAADVGLAPGPEEASDPGVASPVTDRAEEGSP
ncbi:MAG: hypothetical protein R2789_15975 [Microthrixaceae bacterium]